MLAAYPVFARNLSKNFAQHTAVYPGPPGAAGWFFSFSKNVQQDALYHLSALAESSVFSVLAALHLSIVIRMDLSIFRFLMGAR